MNGRRLESGYASCHCKNCLRGRGYKRWKKRQIRQEERRKQKEILRKEVWVRDV